MIGIIPIVDEEITPVTPWENKSDEERYQWVDERINDEVFELECEGEDTLKGFKTDYSIEWVGVAVAAAGLFMPATQIIGIPLAVWFAPQLLKTVITNTKNGHGLQLYPGVGLNVFERLTAEGRKKAKYTGEKLTKPVSSFDYLDVQDKAALQFLRFCRLPLCQVISQAKSEKEAQQLLDQVIERAIVILSRPDSMGVIPAHDEHYLIDKYGIDGSPKAIKEIMPSTNADQLEAAPNTATVDVETVDVETVDVETTVVSTSTVDTEIDLFEEQTEAEIETLQPIANPEIEEQKRYGHFVLSMVQRQRFRRLNPDAPLAELAFTVILGNPGTGKGFLAAYMLAYAKKEENAEIWVLDCKSSKWESGYFVGCDRHYLFDLGSDYSVSHTVNAFMRVIREFSSRVSARKNKIEPIDRPLIIYIADVSPMATKLRQDKETYEEYCLFITQTITQARSENVCGIEDAQTSVLEHLGVKYVQIANIAKFIVCVTGQTAPEMHDTIAKIGFDTSVLKQVPSNGRGWIIRDVNQNTRYIPSPVLKPIPDRPWGSNVIDCRVPVQSPATDLSPMGEMFDPVVAQDEYEDDEVMELNDAFTDPVLKPYAIALYQQLELFPKEWVSVRGLYDHHAKLLPTGKKSKTAFRETLDSFVNAGLLETTYHKNTKVYRLNG